MLLNYIVDEDKYKNVNQVLKQEFNISSRLLNKLILNKHVLLNNKIIDTRSSISINDVVSVNLDFEEESENIVATKMNLDIIYEDEAFIIINKPAGIAIHPSILHYEDSLSNGVKFYFESINLHRKIRPVNRLDFNTSGLVIFAKNEYIQESLIRQMKENIFKKEYIAVVSGHFESPTGTINLPIGRKENSIIERCVDFNNGQEAVTDYEVLQEFDEYSLVKCFLKTGRTHQIRVHMAAISHPILGDSMYGYSSELISRQALHSYKVSFVHPLYKKEVHITCEMPEDIKKLLTETGY